jgi:hypothetical protein
MSDTNKDARKRAQPTSSSGESSTSTPKPDCKKAKPYNPLDEASPLGQRRSKAETFSSSSSSSTLAASPKDQSSEGAEGGEVFNPQNKTIADESLDESVTDNLFELALTAENWDQADALAETDTQRRRAWLARKNKVG